MPLLDLDRRTFLASLLAGAGAAVSPLGARRARAGSAVAPEDRRFIFVTAMGGWDPAMVFADLLDAEAVATEPDAAAATAGSLPYVDHPARPSVRAFYEAMADRLAVVNGVYVSSISHGSATRLFLTGSVTADKGDWPTLLAADHADDFLLPYLLVGGPGFAGPHGVHVSRVGTAGQLQGLIDGTVLHGADMPVRLPDPADSDAVDAWLAEAAARRAEATSSAVEAARLSSYGTALDRARQLKDLDGRLALASGTTFLDQVQLATAALSQGLSRCVQITSPILDSQIEWDTHALHFDNHSPLVEDLFAGLLSLAETLAATPGAVAPTLADEVVVVVMSEMGRTPDLNGGNGKDHWPYTSALLWGPGVAGGQVVGGFDERLFGRSIDPDSGQVDDGGEALGINLLGSTLLALGGVDSSTMQVQADPIRGLLS